MGDGAEELAAVARASVERLEARNLLPQQRDGPQPPPVGLVEGSAGGRMCGFVPPRTLQELGQGASVWDWIQAQPAFINMQSLPQMIAMTGIDEGRSVADERLVQLVPLGPNDSYERMREEQNRTWALDLVAEGVPLARVGKLEEAMRHYDRALAIDPHCVEALVARGAAHTNLGHFGRATSDLEAALRLDPTHGNATKYLEITQLKAQQGANSRSSTGRVAVPNASAAAATLASLSDRAMEKLRQEYENAKHGSKHSSKHRRRSRSRSRSRSRKHRRRRGSSGSDTTSDDERGRRVK